MYDEPYRWIEAIRNRREYLEEQLSAGSPIIALPYQNGILLVTVGSGTAKLYEVYDQIAFGGIGHPADLEKLRTSLLEMAHIEGFNRSPADVNVQRLIKFGLAPLVKQAFEEILHAPYIVNLVLAELSLPSGNPLFFRLNYDGVFEEGDKNLVLAPTSALAQRMKNFLEAAGETTSFSLIKAFQLALRTWAISLITRATGEQPEELPGIPQLDSLLKEKLDKDKSTIEAALLDRTQIGSSKYRSLSKNEIQNMVQKWIKSC